MSESSDQRVVALIDMDCFYVQVELKDRPEFRDKPCVVAQYKEPLGGGIITTNYPARLLGIRRGLHVEQAKKIAEDVIVFFVPERNGKAVLDRYRLESEKFFDVLSSFCSANELVLEKASIDEAFVDLTDAVMSRGVIGNPTDFEEFPNTKIMCDASGDHDKLLLEGARIIQRLREHILSETSLECSAGIAQTKAIAKLCCSFNKPNGQTVLGPSMYSEELVNVDISKLRNFGGKLGDEVKRVLGAKTIGDVYKYSLNELQNMLGTKNGIYVYETCHGIETEGFRTDILRKSFGASKKFSDTNYPDSIKKVEHWLKVITDELCIRVKHDMEKNQRYARTMSVGATLCGTEGIFQKSVRLSRSVYENCENRLFDTALTAFKPLLNRSDETNFPVILQISGTLSSFCKCNQSIMELVSKQQNLEDEHSAASEPSTPKQAQRKRDSKGNAVQTKMDTYFRKSNGPTYVCEKCASVIECCLMFEHDDYHTALELDRQINSHRSCFH